MNPQEGHVHPKQTYELTDAETSTGRQLAYGHPVYSVYCFALLHLAEIMCTFHRQEEPALSYSLCNTYQRDYSKEGLRPICQTASIACHDLQI